MAINWLEKVKNQAYYDLFYLFIGLFMGILGPCLAQLAHLSLSSFVSFGPMFSTHGLGIFVSTVIADMFLPVKNQHKMLMILIFTTMGLALFYFLLPKMARDGIVLVSVGFFVKGICIGLGVKCINILYDADVECAYTAPRRSASALQYYAQTVELANSKTRYHWNMCLSVGCSLGPILVYLYHYMLSPAYFISGLFYTLGSCYVLLSLGLSVKCWNMREGESSLLVVERNTTSLLPRDKGDARDEETRLDSTSAMPSPLCGGIFLSKYIPYHTTLENYYEVHDDGRYNATGSFLVLLATYVALGWAGIQFGHAAFLFGFVQERMQKYVTQENVYAMTTCVLSCYWFSLMVGLLCVRQLVQYTQRPRIILIVQSIACFGACMVIVYSPASLETCVASIFVYGFCISSIFVNCIQALHEALPLSMKARMNSMMIFGAGIGEMFIPMLIGFFMGNESGTTYGSIAVLYVTCVVSFAVAIIAIMIQYTIHGHIIRIKLLSA